MSISHLVLDLVQELLESNRSPEDVCSEHPELLPEVRKQLKRARIVEAQLGELFPSSGDGLAIDFKSSWGSYGELPQIPGYTIEEVIGQGGMGVVFRARHHGLNRLVAIKMLLSGAFASRQEKIRFIHEAEAIAVLQHPNIVEVHDVGELENLPWFTMELLVGGSLAQKLAGNPQPARQSAQMIAELATAVEFAHEHGIVHRDLKPGNVLLSEGNTLKIVDFGLSRRVDATQDMTLTGAGLGTPSYMAPEQVVGKSRMMGPAVDIYALGAILYEMLTGRPPFRAATAVETTRQVVFEEPARPSRIVAGIPRDLETICLKCLSKDPAQRYSSAGRLADDLKNFLENRPILAREVGVFERTVKWARRRPTAAVLIMTLICLVAVTLAGGFWLEQERATQRVERARQEGRASQAVEAALQKAAMFEHQGAWPAARKALIDAEALIHEANNSRLAQQLAHARVDADMVTDLEQIRMRVVEAKRNGEKLAVSPDQLYANAYGNYGIRFSVLRPNEAAELIRSSEIRDMLLTFLYDWLNDISEENRASVEAAVDRADPNEWRRAVRRALSTNDTGRLTALTRAPEATLQPVVVLSGLTEALQDKGRSDDVQSLFREVQHHHSGDFWINYLLGDLLLNERPDDAVGFLSAAVGIRPDSSHAYLLLGRALRNSGNMPGAITAYRKAISLDSLHANARDLAGALVAKAELQESREVWEMLLAANPHDQNRSSGYDELCLFLNDDEAFYRSRKAMLSRPPVTNEYWAVELRTALVCLLRPAGDDELNAILTFLDRAIAQGPKHPHPANAQIQFVTGLSLYRRGQAAQALPLLEESAAILRGQPGPRLVLAMAQSKCQRTTDAKKSLAMAVQGFDWRQQHANSPNAWLNHVLRREAEAMILPDLPDFLEGKSQPQDNEERISLLGIVQFNGLYAAAAELYAAIFANDSHLAERGTVECHLRSIATQDSNQRSEVLNTECRYLAARFAALAESGAGNDGASLSEVDRARLRQRARAWLSEDLTTWEKILDDGSDIDRELTKTMLTCWGVDSDLASLRDSRALDKLSPGEREQFREFWYQVRRLRDRASEPQAPTANRMEARARIRTALIDQRRFEEAYSRWQTDLETTSYKNGTWIDYPELSLFLGHDDDFRRSRRALLQSFGTTMEPFTAERVARPCLLLPTDGETLAATVTLVRKFYIDRPEHQWAYPFFEFTRGLCAYRQGNFEEAISHLRGEGSRVYGPAPGFVLAMSLKKSGRHAQALEALAAAILEYDWRSKFTRDPGAWTFNCLRREAEREILPNMTEFPNGTYQPENNLERLALLGICQLESRWGTAAHLFADAFEADPGLAGQLNAAGFGRIPWKDGTMDPIEVLCSSSLFGAARCAALASTGIGSDHDKFGDAERTSLRNQAIKWLQADLETWKRLFLIGTPAEREVAKTVLLRWETEPDLAGLRDPKALDGLPAVDASRCRQLWNDLNMTLRPAQAAQ